MFPGVPSGNFLFSQRYWLILRKIIFNHDEYFGQLWVGIYMLCYQLLSGYKKFVVFSCTDYLNYETYYYTGSIYTFNTRIHRHNSMIISNMTITLLFILNLYITYNILFTMAKVQFLQCLIIYSFLYTRIYFKLLFTINYIKLLFFISILYNDIYILAFFGFSFIYYYEFQLFVVYNTYSQYFNGITYYGFILSPLANEKASTLYGRDSVLFCSCIIIYITYA